MLISSTPKESIHQTEPLQALYHLALELTVLQNLESVLNTALRHCLELTGSQFGFIGLTNEAEHALEVVAMDGFHPDKQFFDHFHLIPLRPNVFARAVLEDRPIRSHDARVDSASVGQPKGHPPVISFLGVPLRLMDKPIGMIGLANRPEPYDVEHEKLLMTYAAQIAIVIRNAQLYEELTAAKNELELKVINRTQQLEASKESVAQKASQLQKLLNEMIDIEERERHRIAQDMHDGINQLLVGAMLELKSMQHRLSDGHVNQAEDSLQSVRAILHRVEAEIKRIIHDLHPPTLDELGLYPALRRYAERFTRYSNIPCSVRVLGEPMRLQPKVEINTYRLVQEALQNVSSHAHAAQAHILLTFSPQTLKLTVSDDGCGFDYANVIKEKPNHLGLIGMRERAEIMDGHLSIQSKINEGTVVEIMVHTNR
ncbi:MAG: GAF domain-containing sensor histidine kinase [Chloroflexi bacterium]|nr:GAF domain-containing sensor histidine kinase [Chloroflexota bacterium]